MNGSGISSSERLEYRPVSVSFYLSSSEISPEWNYLSSKIFVHSFVSVDAPVLSLRGIVHFFLPKQFFAYHVLNTTSPATVCRSTAPPY